jgi:hypothetical protein
MYLSRYNISIESKGLDADDSPPIHSADIKTATIVAMAIKPVVDFFSYFSSFFYL